jgi:hypothetical protein
MIQDDSYSPSDYAKAQAAWDKSGDTAAMVEFWRRDLAKLPDFFYSLRRQAAAGLHLVACLENY